MLPTLRLAGFEFRRFKGPLPKVALVFLLLIPLLYGAMYLWSNWDPYGRLDQVPVAVVNQDRPVTVDGKTVDAGREFTDELAGDRIFDWHFTDAADAEDGLAHGRYYLTITVPPDFSANLASGSGQDPQRALILMHRDDVNGYVIGLMTASVQTQLEAAIDKAAIGTYFESVFGNLAQIRDQIVQAADGAARLASGTDDAKSGAASLASGLHQAKDGSARLAAGLVDAKNGSAKLADGAATAKDGADKLRSATGQAATGSTQLAAGLDELHTGASTVAQGADQVASGNKQIADTVVPILDQVVPILPRVTQAGSELSGAVADLTAQVAGSTDSLTDRSAAVKSDLDALIKAHPELAGDPAIAALTAAVEKVDQRAGEISDTTAEVAAGAAKVHGVATTIEQNTPEISGQLTGAAAKLTQLADGSQQVAAGAHQLSDGLGSAASSAHTLAGGMAQIDSGAGTLDAGLGTLASGATDLDTGLGTLRDGATSLDSGIGTAVTGADKLSTGIDTLDDGAHQLATSLGEGAKRIPLLTQDQQHTAAQVLASPADVKMTVDHPANVYGRGLAPFFFAIAIWVFGITAFLIMRPIAPRMLAGRASAARLALAGWIPVATMCALGSMILLLVSWFALGLDPLHVGASIGMVLLAAVCFSALAHLLRTALGVVGSAITLVLLMIQLTSAGGLYPVETLPAPLRAIHPVLPMTYLIDGLRIAFTGGPFTHFWRDVAVLAGFTIAALAAGIVVVARKKRFSMSALHPALAA